MENWVERVISDRIRLRKLRWNTSIPAWQVEGIVSHVERRAVGRAGAQGRGV